MLNFCQEASFLLHEFSIVSRLNLAALYFVDERAKMSNRPLLYRPVRSDEWARVRKFFCHKNGAKGITFRFSFVSFYVRQ
jgi:hypothetical protein